MSLLLASFDSSGPELSTDQKSERVQFWVLSGPKSPIKSTLRDWSITPSAIRSGGNNESLGAAMIPTESLNC